MIYNKEMKRLGYFIFGIKLSHKKNNCVQLQTDIVTWFDYNQTEIPRNKKFDYKVLLYASNK